MFLCHCRRSKVGGMGFLKLISQAFPRPLPQSPFVFPALSLALVFARAPLSERLEQANLLQKHFFQLYNEVLNTCPLNSEKLLLTNGKD